MDLSEYFHKTYYPDLPFERVQAAIANEAVYNKAIDYVQKKYYSDIPIDNIKSKLKSTLSEDVANKGEPDTSKEDYINYLKSKNYFLTATQQWGAANAQNKIDEQILKVKNTAIEDWRSMGMQDKIEYLHNPDSKAEFNPATNKILNYKNNPQYNIHELSHSTDRGLTDLPKDIFTKKEIFSPSGQFQKTKYSLNPKYIEDETITNRVLNINPDFSSFNQFQQYDDDKIEYLSNPTEVRARVNTLREYLTKKGVNYHNMSEDEIYDYINKDKTLNSPVQISNFKTDDNPFESDEDYQKDNLDELQKGINNKYPLNKVLQLFGSNTKKDKMPQPVANQQNLT